MADLATIMKMMDDQIKEANEKRASQSNGSSSVQSPLSTLETKHEASSKLIDSGRKMENEKWDLGKPNITEGRPGGFRRSMESPKTFPPPMSSLGPDGRPLYFFRSVRENGRLVMKMFKYPPRPDINSCRENGPSQIPPKEDGSVGEPGAEAGAVGETVPGVGNHEADEGDGAADRHAVEGGEKSGVNGPN